MRMLSDQNDRTCLKLVPYLLEYCFVEYACCVYCVSCVYLYSGAKKLHDINVHLSCTKPKHLQGMHRQRRPRSYSADVQSDQGVCCPLQNHWLL